MSQEHSRTNKARFGEVYTSNLENDRERFLSARRTDFIKTIFDLGRPMKLHRDGRSRLNVL